ncbi:hypothetical protein C8Q77DRAFT_1214064 [Trametes polyzona]|nr:hypothetical protein C8Q77DRAFT_1214064 [Trametes polyzona]
MAGSAFLREYHPFLDDGNFLSEGADPPPRAEQPGPDDWSPFESRVEFELAEFLYKTEQMSGKNISTLMNLWAAHIVQYGGRPPFADQTDMYRAIDAIAHGDVPWKCFKVRYSGPRPTSDVPSWMNNEYDVWYRNPREITLRMLENPDFKDEFDVAPYREFTPAPKRERRYSHYMSGNWAWRQADLIMADNPEACGAMFVPVLCGSDKTTVSVATGQNDYYPLYMSIGNIHNNVRRAHRESVILIAFLAIPKAERKHADTPIFRKFRRQLFHTSLSAILRTLRPGMTTPEIVRCPDAHFRKAIWGIGAYIADYIEQVIVACIVQGWCPACLKYPNQLDAPAPGDRRSQVHTDGLIRTFEPSVLWDNYGVIHDVIPFTHDFPHADIHELLSGDILHQLIKGTFKDHLVTWVGEYLTLTYGETRGKELLDEIDRRLSVIPPFPGLRHFKQGRDFKQWTGDDSKALMKIYLAPISGILPSKMVRAIADFIEACYVARKEALTESDLTQFERARDAFHRNRAVFQESGVRPDGFSLPRQHSLEHYPQHIRNFGAPNGLCTSITEAKHIKAVKEPWRRSNRYEPLGQMLLTNQRLDKLAAARIDFDARGMLQGSCYEAMLTALEASLDHDTLSNDPSPRSSPSDDREDLCDDWTGLSDASQPSPNDEEPDNGIVDGPRVSGFVVLPQRLQKGYPRTLRELGNRIGVPELPTLIARFVFNQLHPDDAFPDDQELTTFPTCRVRVYHSVIATFYAPSDPSGIGGMHRERIRATPSWRRGPPHYDCVYIGKDPSASGFRSLHAARVRLFFSFLAPPSTLGDEAQWTPCALVEWYSPVGDQPDEDTGLWIVEPDLEGDGSRSKDVVHINSLLRAAHLIPVFGDQPTPPQLKQHESLDSYRAFYVNKFVDYHAFEIAF